MHIRSNAPFVRDLGSAHALFEPLAVAATETAAFAFLAGDGRVLGMRHIRGNCVDAVDLPVRRVVADALAFDARGVVMAHNHPSGDPSPSGADRATTRRLLAALDPVGVRLVDHLILAHGGTVSFLELGWL